MFILRVKTLSVLDLHWWNQRKKNYWESSKINLCLCTDCLSSLGGEGWITVTVGPCFHVFSTIQGKTRAMHLLSLLLCGSTSVIITPMRRPAHVAKSWPVWWMRPIMGLISTHSCPQFWRFQLTQNSNSTQPEFILGLQSRLKLHNLLVWLQKFKPLPVIWQSLPKAIPEDNRRFWLQNQWPSSWGHAPAQLGWVRRAI